MAATNRDKTRRDAMIAMVSRPTRTDSERLAALKKLDAMGVSLEDLVTGKGTRAEPEKVYMASSLAAEQIRQANEQIRKANAIIAQKNKTIAEQSKALTASGDVEASKKEVRRRVGRIVLWVPIILWMFGAPMQYSLIFLGIYGFLLTVTGLEIEEKKGNERVEPDAT